MAKLQYYSSENVPVNFTVNKHTTDDSVPAVIPNTLETDKYKILKDVNDYFSEMKNHLDNIFNNDLLSAVENMITVDNFGFSDKALEKFNLEKVIKKINDDCFQNEENLKSVIESDNSIIGLIKENLRKLSENKRTYNEKRRERDDLQSRLGNNPDDDASLNSRIDRLNAEISEYDNDGKISIFDKFTFVPKDDYHREGSTISLDISKIEYGDYNLDSHKIADFAYSARGCELCVDYCKSVETWLLEQEGIIDKIPTGISYKFENPSLNVSNIVNYSQSNYALKSLYSVVNWLIGVCDELALIVKNYDTYNENEKSKIGSFLKDGILKYGFTSAGGNNFESIFNEYLKSDKESFSEFILSENGISSNVIDMEKFFEDIGKTGTVVSTDYTLSKLADGSGDEEEEHDEEEKEEDDDESNNQLDNEYQEYGNQTGEYRRTGNRDNNSYVSTPGSSSDLNSSSSSLNIDTIKNDNNNKNTKEETIVVKPDDKKTETQTTVSTEKLGDEVYVDPQPAPANPVEPTKFVPQNESSYHGGGGYSSEGYVSTTGDASSVEDIIDDSPVSLEDVIKDNGIYPEIPRKIPIENHGTVKSSGSNVIPIVAGLTSVGAAGLGSKAYLDHKRNNSDNDEYDEADEYDDYDETPEKVEEVDADVIINDNPDSDLNPLNNNESNDEVTFDDDDYS